MENDWDVLSKVRNIGPTPIAEGSDSTVSALRKTGHE
jgi:hypothetical protein